MPAASQFAPPDEIRKIQTYGRGNVHDTYLVTLDRDSHFILQRLNTEVFRQPQLVMANLRAVSEHVARRLEGVPLGSGRRWEMPRVLAARDGRDHWLSPEGFFWRGLSFIDGAESFDAITDLQQAQEVGFALGLFHRLLSDLGPQNLADTLPGFHVTPLYLRHYDEVLAQQGAGQSPEVTYAMKFIEARRALADVLEAAKAQGRLGLRIIHGDPKVNNVLMDVSTGQAVALVDLDTVKPGLVHYDIGDCLRSGANPLGEETSHWEAVGFDLEFCRAILQGYLPQAWDFLTANDYEYLYDAIRLIAFELGLRFFTDYLAGDVYFKARHRQHNLARSLVQFRLTESIEAQERSIRVLIQDLK